MSLQRDKIKHFAVCLAVSFAAASIECCCGAHYIYAAFAGLVAGIAIGVGKEYGDHCAPGNRWSWSDIIADALGAVCGAALGSLFSL